VIEVPVTSTDSVSLPVSSRLVIVTVSEARVVLSASVTVASRGSSISFAASPSVKVTAKSLPPVPWSSSASRSRTGASLRQLTVTDTVAVETPGASVYVNVSGTPDTLLQ
jgi:hypothetical protein